MRSRRHDRPKDGTWINEQWFSIRQQKDHICVKRLRRTENKLG